MVLENDDDVLKWFKPSKGDFQIYYCHDEEYVPDFAVETADCCYLLRAQAAERDGRPGGAGEGEGRRPLVRPATEHAAASRGNTC